MSESFGIITLDVRGEICPAPFIKAMEAMRNAEQSQQIELITDFMPAVLAVTNGALKEVWDIHIENLESSEWKVRLERPSSTAMDSGN